MSDFQICDLRINVTNYGYALLVIWSGVGDPKAGHSRIRPFLEGLKSEFDGRHVTMDFRGLRYANSSVISEIIVAVRLAASSANRVVVHYDAQHRTQKTLFSMLEKLHSTMSHVRFVNVSR